MSTALRYKDPALRDRPLYAGSKQSEETQTAQRGWLSKQTQVEEIFAAGQRHAMFQHAYYDRGVRVDDEDVQIEEGFGADFDLIDATRLADQILLNAEAVAEQRRLQEKRDLEDEKRELEELRKLHKPSKGGPEGSAPAPQGAE